MVEMYDSGTGGDRKSGGRAGGFQREVGMVLRGQRSQCTTLCDEVIARSNDDVFHWLPTGLRPESTSPAVIVRFFPNKKDLQATACSNDSVTHGRGLVSQTTIT